MVKWYREHGYNFIVIADHNYVTTVEFIGLNGTVLQKTYDNPTSYTIKGNETYIRVRIMDSNGFKAWTQPVFVKY